LLAYPTTDTQIKIKNEWRRRPLHNWKHVYKASILKATSPRAKALELLHDLPFDYFTDVPLLPSPHLRLVARLFCPSNPVRFVAPNAYEFVPNRIISKKRVGEHSESSQAKRKNSEEEDDNDD